MSIFDVARINQGRYYGDPDYTSGAVPVAEPDRIARYNAFFQGLTGVIDRADDVLDRVGYDPSPANLHERQPKGEETYLERLAGKLKINPNVKVNQASININPVTIALIVGGLVVVVYLMKMRRR